MLLRRSWTAHGPRRWLELCRETLREFSEDNGLGIAAQLAFYFLLALFPALLFVVAVLSFVPASAAFADLLVALETVAPPEAVTLLHGQLDQITGGGQTSLLTLGVLGAVWSSSAAVVALIDALNHAYDVVEWRPWWRRRLVAILLTFALACCVVVSLSLVAAGPALAAGVVGWAGLAPAVAWIWPFLRWPILLACIVLAVNLVYYAAPNRPARWRWVTPGSVVATGLWLVSSFGFKQYVVNAADYAATYGAIGGAIVTMLWFYVSGVALLIGAELNGVIESRGRAR